MVYNTSTGNKYTIIEGISGRILDIEVESNIIYVGVDMGRDYPGKLLIYDRNFNLIDVLIYDHVYSVHGVDACGDLLAVGLSRGPNYGETIIYKNNNFIKNFEYKVAVQDLEFSPDCAYLAVSGDQLIIYETSTWKQIANISSMGSIPPLWISWYERQLDNMYVLAAGLRSGVEGTLVLVGIDSNGEVRELLRERVVKGWIHDVEIVDFNNIYVGSQIGLLRVEVDTHTWNIKNITTIITNSIYILDYNEMNRLLAVVPNPTQNDRVLIYKVNTTEIEYGESLVSLIVHAPSGTKLIINKTLHIIDKNNTILYLKPGKYIINYTVPVDVGSQHFKGYKYLTINNNTIFKVPTPPILTIVSVPGSIIVVEWEEEYRVFEVPTTGILKLTAYPENYTIYSIITINNTNLITKPVKISVTENVTVGPVIVNALLVYGPPGSTIEFNNNNYVIKYNKPLLIMINETTELLTINYAIPVDLGGQIKGVITVNLTNSSLVQLPWPAQLEVYIPRGVWVAISGNETELVLDDPGSYHVRVPPGQYYVSGYVNGAGYPGSQLVESLNVRYNENYTIRFPSPGFILVSNKYDVPVRVYINGTLVTHSKEANISVFPGVYFVKGGEEGIIYNYGFEHVVIINPMESVSISVQKSLKFEFKLIIILLFSSILSYFALFRPRINIDIVESYIIENLGARFEIRITNKGLLPYEGILRIIYNGNKKEIPIKVNGRKTLNIKLLINDKK